MRPVVVQGHKRVIVKATGCAFDSYTKFYFVVLVSKQSVVLSSAT